MIFWFGLFGLVFLIWCWEGSGQKYTEIRFPTSKFRFMVGDGSVEFTWFQSAPGDRFDPSFDSWWTKRGLKRGHFDFPQAFVANHAFAPAYRTWTIALWLMISIYVPVWLATLWLLPSFMRQRSAALPAMVGGPN